MKQSELHTYWGSLVTEVAADVAKYVAKYVAEYVAEYAAVATAAAASGGDESSPLCYKPLKVILCFSGLFPFPFETK